MLSHCGHLTYFGITYLTRVVHILFTIMQAEAVDTPNKCPISRYELLVANLQTHNTISLSVVIHFLRRVSFFEAYGHSSSHSIKNIVLDILKL